MTAGTKLTTAVALATLAVAVAPAVNAEPGQGPGSGDPFFISEVTNKFHPPASAAKARAIILLAHQVCDAEAQGQDDFQAAHIVLAGKGVDTLGVPSGSLIGDEKTALDIVDAATLAYCPTYNHSNF